MKRVLLILMLASSVVLTSGTVGHAASGLIITAKPSTFLPREDGTSRIDKIKIRLENYGKKRSFDCTVKFEGGNVKTVLRYFSVFELPHLYYVIKYVSVPRFTKRYASQPIGQVFVFVNCSVA